MGAKLYSETIASGQVIKPCGLQHLKGQTSLRCLIIPMVQFAMGFKLKDLYLGQNISLECLDLTGSTGLVIPLAMNNVGLYQNPPVPTDWKNLTKLGIISFRDSGFSAVEVDNLLIGLSQVSALGLGSAATAKVIALDGANAAPTANSAAALAALIADGWTVLHSDLAASGTIPSCPCCEDASTGGGGCTGCETTTVMVSVAVAGLMDNGQTEIAAVNVPGLVLGANNSVQLATDISALVASGVIVSHLIIANDTLQVTIKNETGNDGLAMPTLAFNIYIPA